MSVITLDNISIQHDQNILVQPHTLKIPDTGLNVITGPNGSGKTSLLKKIAELVQSREPKISLGFMSALQQYERLMPLTGREFFDLYSQSTANLNDFSFLLEKKISAMSAGEFQCLVLLAHLNSTSKILFLDEPFSHLSTDWTDKLGQLVQTASRHKCLFMVSHHLHASDSFLQGPWRHLQIKDCVIVESAL